MRRRSPCPSAVHSGHHAALTPERAARDTGTMAGLRGHQRRAEDLVPAVTADAHRDRELTALAAVAEAVLADLRSVALAIKALVGPVGVDLADANLAGADLHGANLAGADLT